MKIRIEAHTLNRAEERGTDPKEIIDVITTGFRVPAKHGREGKAKIYSFGRHRCGTRYEQKRVEVFYTVESDVIVTVTVYVFYGRWEREDADSI